MIYKSGIDAELSTDQKLLYSSVLDLRAFLIQNELHDTF